MGEKTRKKENPHKGCGFGYAHIAFVYNLVYNTIINK